MIGMHSATAAGAGTSLPVLAAGAAPPAALPAADPAFDDVFRQLVGALLTSAADASEAVAEADDEIVEAEVAATATDDTSVMVTLTVPMMTTLPVAQTAPADESASGGPVIGPELAGSTASASRDSSAVQRRESVRGAGTTTATTTTATNTHTTTGPATVAAPGAASTIATAAGSVAAAPTAGHGATINTTATPTATSTATASVAPTPTTSAPLTAHAAAAPGPRDTDVLMVSPDDAVTGGLSAGARPASTVASETPPTEVEAHVRGLARRRGMRETSARGRTVDDPAAAAPVESGGSKTTPIEATPGPAGSALPSGPSPAALPREMPMPAERALALQRALSRQMARDTHETPAPGLVTQAALSAVASGTGSGTETGTEHGSAPHDSGRKPGRRWTGTPPTGSPAAGVPTEVAAGVPGAGAHDPASVPGPAAGAAWRAALASSAVAEALMPAVDAARTAGLPGAVATMLHAFDGPTLRDRAPMTVDAPALRPDLDGPTAESVHTQIVRSIRMQWTGAASSEARVTLRPEYLGEVVATIKVDQGVVTATLQADTPEVRRWMESHIATLRDALVEHGLKLDRLLVSEPEKQSANGDRQAKSRQRQQDAPRQRARRDTSDHDTPFEVTTE